MWEKRSRRGWRQAAAALLLLLPFLVQQSPLVEACSSLPASGCLLRCQPAPRGPAGCCGVPGAPRHLPAEPSCSSVGPPASHPHSTRARGGCSASTPQRDGPRGELPGPLVPLLVISGELRLFLCCWKHGCGKQLPKKRLWAEDKQRHCVNASKTLPSLGQAAGYVPAFPPEVQGDQFPHLELPPASQGVFKLSPGLLPAFFLAGLRKEKLPCSAPGWPACSSTSCSVRGWEEAIRQASASQGAGCPAPGAEPRAGGMWLCGLGPGGLHVGGAEGVEAFAPVLP